MQGLASEMLLSYTVLSIFIDIMVEIIGSDCMLKNMRRFFCASARICIVKVVPGALLTNAL